MPNSDDIQHIILVQTSCWNALQQAHERLNERDTPEIRALVAVKLAQWNLAFEMYCSFVPVDNGVQH